MSKFLLILILFSPAQDRYKDIIMTFDTQAECEATLEQVRRGIAPIPGVYFTLNCVQSKPTISQET